jgi:peptidoglycan/xylan/chitin deacetylase (PgdA/CDA1 family)
MFSQTILLSWKRWIFKATAFLVCYGGGLKFFNRIANLFEMNKDTRGKLLFPFVKKRRSGNVQILVYHRVNNDKDPFFPGVPVDVFKSQMDYLASNFNIFSLEDGLERLIKKDVPDNAIVITFDDGYRDNYTDAFPILKNLSIPATIFLATDAIGTQRTLWHDIVFSAFRETRVNLLKGFGNNSATYRLNTVEEKLFAQGKILNFIRSQKDSERLRLIDSLLEELKVMDRKEAPRLMLSWEEARVMRNGGISFGSHTVTHPVLSKLSLDQVQHEIQESKKVIEESLSIAVRTFAYPNGKENDFNQSIKALLREAGYTCALTTQFGTNECGQDLFELRRATPWDHHIEAFGLRLNYYKFCT